MVMFASSASSWASRAIKGAVGKVTRPAHSRQGPSAVDPTVEDSSESASAPASDTEPQPLTSSAGTAVHGTMTEHHAQSTADDAAVAAASEKSKLMTSAREQMARAADRYSSPGQCTMQNIKAVTPAGQWPSDDYDNSNVPHCTEILCRLMQGVVRENPKTEIEFGTVTFKSSPGPAGEDTRRPNPEELDSVVSFFEQSVACDWVHFCSAPWRNEHRFHAMRRA